MGKFRCPVKGCDWVKDIFYHDGEGIREVLDHGKEHRKNTIEVEKTGRDECNHCEGKGYIEYTYTIDEDVSETN